MLQHPVGVHPVRARLGQRNGVDVAVHDPHPRQSPDPAGRLAHRGRIAVHADDQAALPRSPGEGGEIGARAASEVDDHVAGADPELGRRQALVSLPEPGRRDSHQVVVGPDIFEASRVHAVVQSPGGQ